MTVEPLNPGKLQGIWVKRMKGEPMERRDNGTLCAGSGLVENNNQGGERQVIIMDTQRWAGLEQQMGVVLDPSVRRGNLLVSGVKLSGSKGRVLLVGECRIRILGAARPCERMDQAFPGLRSAMEIDWGGGALGEVLDDGEIVVGQPVRWEDS